MEEKRYFKTIENKKPLTNDYLKNITKVKKDKLNRCYTPKPR